MFACLKKASTSLVFVAVWLLCGPPAAGRADRFTQGQAAPVRLSRIELLAKLVAQSDTIFYFNSGHSDDLVTLGHLVGEEGVLISTNMDEAATNRVNAQLQAEGLWSRSLILSPLAILSSDASQHFSVSQNLFVQLYDLVGKRCPSLMVFHFDGSAKEDAVFSKALRLATFCQTSIFMDGFDGRLSSFQSTADLQARLSRSLFTFRSDSSAALLSVPSTSTAYSLLLSLGPSNLNKLSVEANTHHLCSYGRSGENEENCREGIVVDPSVLLAPFTITRCLLDLPQSPLHLSHPVPNTIWLPTNFTDQVAAESAVSYYCTLWAEFLVQSMPVPLQLHTGPRYCSHRHSNMTLQGMDSAIVEEMDDILRNCFAFGSKRYSTLRVLASQQEDAGSAVYRPPSLSESSANVLTKTEFAPSSPSVDSSISDVTSAPGFARYNASAMNLSAWLRRPVFGMQFDSEVCGEPIWCEYTNSMQMMIYEWQFPPFHSPAVDPHESSVAALPHSCDTARFLVYEVPSSRHGIGSMLMILTTLFRYATCLNRILVLNMRNQSPKLLKWRHPGCQGNLWECYFQPITHCELSHELLRQQPVYTDEASFDVSPLRDQRILVLSEAIPKTGKCVSCYDDWDMSSRFWQDTYLPGYNHDLLTFTDYTINFRAFTDRMKLTWTAQFLRFLTRPRPWFAQAIDQLVAHSMYSPWPHGPSPPEQFVSMHVRYGAKIFEIDRQPLQRYMTFLRKKLPHIRDVFLSTETEAVIGSLSQSYPEYRFHFLRYPRMEMLNVNANLADQSEVDGRLSAGNFVNELMMAMANLYVASEADGFVGTLSSNWCMMIHHLERTRGDGGFDYYSMDAGTVFTLCF